MKSIIALENLIKDEEKRLSILKRQLAEHESGETKLTLLQKASSESSIEVTKKENEKHKLMLDKLLRADLQELEKQERLEEAITRKNYFHYQKVRLKRDKTRKNDKKLEAMLILDELPEEIQFEDDELFDLAKKSIELDISTHELLDKELKDIKVEFTKLLKECKDEDISVLGMLSSRIPILVLHFSILLSNIKENREKDKLPPFSGFPKFEDWWIEELWYSHQAYLGLYKWKGIVNKLCNSADQRNAWESIFSNWISIKKIINRKGVQAYQYNFAFDTLIQKYADLEEELVEINIISMDSIVAELTKKENFSKQRKNHNIETAYLTYKRIRLNHKEK